MNITNSAHFKGAIGRRIGQLTARGTAKQFRLCLVSAARLRAYVTRQCAVDGLDDATIVASFTDADAAKGALAALRRKYSGEDRCLNAKNGGPLGKEGPYHLIVLRSMSAPESVGHDLEGDDTARQNTRAERDSDSPHEDGR